MRGSKEYYNGAKKAPVPDDWLAAETGKQGPEKRLERYKSARLFNENVLTNLEKSKSSMKRYQEKIRDCGSWLVLRHYTLVNETRVIKANFCKKHLLCNLCALRRSALQVQAFEKKLRSVMNDDPDLVPVLVTLTVKNGVSLEERFRHIDSCLSRLIKKRHDAISKSRENTILRHVLGGSGSYEFKRGSGSGLWHPHVHQIWLLRKDQFAFTLLQKKKRMVWVPIELENALRQEWKAITDGSDQIDIRRIELEKDKDRFGAICEAFKYALKSNGMKAEDQIYAAEVLQGRRLQRAFGILYGVEINEDLVDSAEKELALQPYIDLVYNWNSGGYILIESTDYGPSETWKKSKKHLSKIPDNQPTAGFTQKQIENWLAKKMSLQKHP